MNENVFFNPLGRLPRESATLSHSWNLILEYIYRVLLPILPDIISVKVIRESPNISAGMAFPYI